jgi:hypothetical protein
MPEPDLIFAIPTYRLRDVSETVEKYDETFWNNGHSPRIIVFDDSSVANHAKYYPLLEATKTRNDVYYVGLLPQTPAGSAADTGSQPEARMRRLGTRQRPPQRQIARAPARVASGTGLL